MVVGVGKPWYKSVSASRVPSTTALQPSVARSTCDTVAVREIFRPVPQGEDWHRNAVVQRHSDHGIAIGFADVADLIVEHWVRTGPNDLLFEPLLFNHRPALELILKAAVRETAACLRANGDPDPKLRVAAVDEWLAKEARHSLQKLATRLDTMLTKLGLDRLPPDTLGALASLHQLDAGGDSFRYAKVRGSDGAWMDAPRPLLATTEDVQSLVDVAALHERFRLAFSVLSNGVMTVLEELRLLQGESAHDSGR